MRIGIDCRLWNESGVGRYIRNLVGQLQELDKRNEYVLFVLSKDRENIQFQISNSKFQIKVADFRWHSIEEQVRFPSILKKEKLDLVHFPYISVPVFYNKPFVVTIHDLIPLAFPTAHASTLPVPLYQSKLIGYKYVVSKASKNAKKIIVPSETVKDDVVKYLNVNAAKIAVTYEGVELTTSDKQQAKNEIHAKYQIPNTKYFLYVGNAYPHKNLDNLVEAVREILGDKDTKILSKNGEKLKMIFVGKEDYFYKRLKKIIKSLELGEHFTFLHEVTDEELTQLYQNAAALIMPSKMEGFGLPVVEAMALKCLVLASDIPIFHEICDNTAIYFNPDLIPDIKEKIIDVLHLSSSDKEKFTSDALKRTEKFSWKKMTEKTIHIYESAIKTT